jgi:hypothetical protein
VWGNPQLGPFFGALWRRAKLHLEFFPRSIDCRPQESSILGAHLAKKGKNCVPDLRTIGGID